MMTLYESFISRKDGLYHLLLSDTNDLMDKLAAAYPSFVKVESIGKSYEGRDINMLVIDKPSDVKNKPAFLMTGATHARELISTSFNVYQMLKLILKGEVNKIDKYEELLNNNKFYFIPILNPDGVAYIEKHWVEDKKFIPQRKNMDTEKGCNFSEGNLGVDLNRNFAIDFGEVDDTANYQSHLNDWIMTDADEAKKKKADPCVYNFAGPTAFSEPETRAFRDFLTAKQKELTFVLNVHSNGMAFIYPFNGR